MGIVSRKTPREPFQPMTNPNPSGALVDRLNKMARCVYLATEQSVADDISDGLLKAASALTDKEKRIGELDALLRRIEPHIDAIVCYASTMGEHEPNRLAADLRAALKEDVAMATKMEEDK